MGVVIPRANGAKIGNFKIDIRRVVNIHCGSSEKGTRCVEIILIFENGESSDIKRVPISNLSRVKWIEEDDRVVLIPNMPFRTAGRHIVHDIQAALGECPVVDVYQMDRPGLYIVDGKPVFCTGGEVIRPPAGAAHTPEIECGKMSERLDYDPNLSEEEAISEVLNLISLFPIPGRVILVQVLVCLMRQAYEDAGKVPSFCVFLYGKSGTQKTTVASFLTQIYNRADGIAAPTRLNTSRASATEMLMGLDDQVKVFDDLFPSDSGQIRKKQEEILSEITRYIGDGTIPTKMRGGKVREGRPKCGVLFTGEYLIGTGSDAARLLPVEMTKPDTSALSHFQEHPLTVSTAYRNFIQWFVDNYDEVVSYLKEWSEEYRKADLGVHDRLREAHFFLNTAYSLLLNYCGEKGVLSESEIVRFHDSFMDSLIRLVREQNERVCPAASTNPQQGNVLERIRELYLNGQFSIPPHKDQFARGLHDGVMHKEYLCLHSEALSRFFPSMDPNDVAAELNAVGALDKPKNGFKKKISAAKGSYFYWIPLRLLQ